MTESQLRQRYPIDLQVEGWFFRIEEKSAGHYVAEGADARGSIASVSGDDPDDLLARCAESARHIKAQVPDVKQSRMTRG
jgi:hypothetical protein